MGSEHGPNRRTVLKQLGAAAATGAALGAGTSGTVAARDGGVDMKARSLDGVDVNRVIKANASQLLGVLASEGVLDGSVAALATRPVDPRTDSSREGASSYVVDGESGRKRIVTVDTHVDGGVLELTVEPEAGRALAVLERDDGSTVRYATAGDGVQSEEVSTDSEPCCACTVCTGLLCSDQPVQYTRIAYGPERFGCPSAFDGCC